MPYYRSAPMYPHQRQIDTSLSRPRQNAAAPDSICQRPELNLPPSLSRREFPREPEPQNPYATGNLVDALAQPPSGPLNGVARPVRPRKATHRLSDSRHPSLPTRVDAAARAASLAARQQAARERAATFATLPPPITQGELIMWQNLIMQWELAPPLMHVAPVSNPRQPLGVVPLPRDYVLVPLQPSPGHTAQCRYLQAGPSGARPQDRGIYHLLHEQPAPAESWSGESSLAEWDGR